MATCPSSTNGDGAGGAALRRIPPTLAALLPALVLTLVLGVASASAAYKQTAKWDVTPPTIITTAGATPTLSHGIGVAPFGGGVFSSLDITQNALGQVDKWTPLGERGVPGFFGTGHSVAAAGVAVHPANGNVYVLADRYGAVGTGNLTVVTGTGDRSALATGTGKRTMGSPVLTELATAAGTFTVGESISGTGIPVGTTIDAIDTEAATLTMSANASSGAAANTNLTSGSKVLTNVSGAFSAGMTISGTGIQASTTINAIDTEAGTLTLSRGVTGAATGTALTGKSPVIANVAASSGAFAVGQTVTGTGIPGSTTVEAVDTEAQTMTLSKPADVAGTGVALRGGPPVTSVSAYQPDGTPVGTPIPVSSTGSKRVGIDVDAAGNVYVPDPTAKVVKKYEPDGDVAQTFTTAPDHGNLNDPADVALDADGNLYVADRSTSRVNEVQVLNVHGATGGTVELTFDGATTGATFKGDTSVATGTADVNRVAGTADRTVLATGTGVRTDGSKLITNLNTTTGTFTVGESISGSSGGGGVGPGIQPGTMIAAVDSDAGTLTLSKPIRVGNGSTDSIGFTSGSKTLTNVTNAGDFKVGMTIGGAGMQTTSAFGSASQSPHATTITAVDSDAGTLTLSNGVTAAGTGTAITASEVVNLSTLSGQFKPGMVFKSSLFGFATIPVPIVDVGPGSITVAEVASGPGTGVALDGASPVIENVEVTDGQLAPGLAVSGPGITPNITIRSFDLEAGTINLSAAGVALPVTAGGSEVTLEADVVPVSGSGQYDLTAAVESLPTVGVSKRFDGLFVPVTRGETRNVNFGSLVFTFHRAMGGRNLPETTCDGSGLTGGPTPGICSVTTSTNGSANPGRVVKFDANGEFVEDFIPAAGTYTAEAIAVDRESGDVFVAGGNGPWGNLTDIVGANAPDFSVKRYDSDGNQHDEIGAGAVTAVLLDPHISEAQGHTPPSAFGLAVDPGTRKVYTVSSTGDGSRFISGMARSTVHAFSPGHTLTVTPENLGGATGTVSANVGDIASCAVGGGTCTSEYLFGDTVTLTADPGPNSEVSWEGCDDEPSADECEVTVAGLTDVTAAFSIIQRTLTVNPGGNGTGTVSADTGAISGCAKGDLGTCSGPYDQGSTVTLTATPGPNSAVSWEGCTNVNGNECQVEIPADDVEVDATFTLDQRSLSTDITGQGTITCAVGAGAPGPCATSYDDGTELTVTALAAEHFQFAGFAGSTGSALDCSTSPCTFTITESTVVKATFDPIPRSLSFDQTGDGDGTVECKVGAGAFGACAASYDSGTQLTVRVTPDAHSSFGGFDGSTGSAQTCTGTADCSFTIAATTVVKVPLALVQRSLSFDQTGDGDGTVECKVGAGAFGACAASYDSGTQLTVRVTPDAHSSFGGFDGSTGSAQTCTGTADCSFTIAATTVVKVPLALVQRTLTRTTTGGTGTGTITCNGGACQPTYPDGTTVTLAAVPTGPSAFKAWTVTGSASTATPCTGTITPCQVKLEGGNVAANAAFDLILHDLTVTPQGNGAGTVGADSGDIANCSKAGGTCTDSYVQGTTLTLTATPANSHSSVTWGNCPFVNANTCTVTVDEDTEVTATFTLDSHSLTVGKTGSGSGAVTCNGGACAPTYTHGTTVNLAAAPDAGSSFAGWSGACSGSGACAVTLDADTSVSAAFDANPAVAPPPGDGPKANVAAYGKCAKQANQVHKKALKKAKRKRGKAKAKAIKAANKGKSKALSRCKARFKK